MGKTNEQLLSTLLNTRFRGSLERRITSEENNYNENLSYSKMLGQWSTALQYLEKVGDNAPKISTTIKEGLADIQANPHVRDVSVNSGSNSKELTMDIRLDGFEFDRGSNIVDYIAYPVLNIHLTDAGRSIYNHLSSLANAKAYIDRYIDSNTGEINYDTFSALAGATDINAIFLKMPAFDNNFNLMDYGEMKKVISNASADVKSIMEIVNICIDFIYADTGLRNEIIRRLGNPNSRSQSYSMRDNLLSEIPSRSPSMYNVTYGRIAYPTIWFRDKKENIEALKELFNIMDLCEEKEETND